MSGRTNSRFCKKSCLQFRWSPLSSPLHTCSHSYRRQTTRHSSFYRWEHLLRNLFQEPAMGTDWDRNWRNTTLQWRIFYRPEEETIKNSKCRFSQPSKKEMMEWWSEKWLFNQLSSEQAIRCQILHTLWYISGERLKEKIEVDHS